MFLLVRNIQKSKDFFSTILGHPRGSVKPECERNTSLRHRSENRLSFDSSGGHLVHWLTVKHRLKQKQSQLELDNVLIVTSNLSDSGRGLKYIMGGEMKSKFPHGPNATI